MIIPKYVPPHFYIESSKMYLSEENKNIGHYIAINTGMRRKGLAIAQDKDSFYIINKDDLVIYKTEKNGIDSYNGEYSYSIKRTIFGYYVIIRDGLVKITNVGKDDDFYPEQTYKVLDENGNIVENWKAEQVGINQYPFELGNGIIAWENVCYDIESLKPLFTIPSKFKIEGIIEKGLFYLSVPGDYKDFAVVVRNGEIVKQCDISELEQLKNRLSLQEKEFEKHFIRKLGVVSNSKNKDLEEGEHLIKQFCSICYSNGNTHPDRYRLNQYIYNADLAKDDFTSLKQIDSVLVKKLKLIHLALSKDSEPRNQNRGSRYIVYLTRDVMCFFYKHAYILKYIPGNMSLYRFFSLEGQALSMESYENLSQYNSPTLFYNDKKFDRRFFIFKNANPEKKSLISISEKGLFSKDIPYNIDISEQDGFIEMYNRDNQCSAFYDFDLKELQITYVRCKIEERIKDYLYILRDNFLLEKEYECGGAFGRLANGQLILKHSTPKMIIKDGKLLLPFPNSYEKCLEEISARHNNRPNYVVSVNEIANYQLEEGKTYIYMFNCRPWAFCNVKGGIYYDFDIQKINFLNDSNIVNPLNNN